MATVRDLALGGGGYLDAHINEPGGSGGGGDASAANQVLANTKLDTIHTDLQSLINGTSTINVADDISVIYVGSTAYTVKRGPVALAASGDVIAAVGGKKIYVLSYSLVSNGAGTIKFQSNATSDLTGAMPVAANGGLVDQGLGGIMAGAAVGEKINLVLTGAATAQGRIAWIEV